MPNKHIKTGSTSPNIKEIKIKTVIRYTSYPLQLSKEKKKGNDGKCTNNRCIQRKIEWTCKKFILFSFWLKEDISIV